jgi:hypothetical protein
VLSVPVVGVVVGVGFVVGLFFFFWGAGAVVVEGVYIQQGCLFFCVAWSTGPACGMSEAQQELGGDTRTTHCL